MRYVSTRGQAPALNFADVTLAGLARDGGLYVPERWPSFSKGDIVQLAGKSYAEAAVRVMRPFVADALSEETLSDLVADAYGGFRHAAVAPLTQLDANDWLLELFHGPTLAFKDVALQLLGRLFDHFLTARGQRVTIVGATSGDTGSAAIEACRDRSAIEIFMLHPAGRVSEVQRRQMTTVLSPNVHNIAIDGTFDDCQAMVKAMFNDLAFRDAMQLSAVNSINWARVMAQVVYYFTSAVALGAPHRPVAFSVPTGNFGDVYAGYVAACMGLPVDKLIVATNINDILARALQSGAYAKGEVYPTITPSMDIQVSSNFERLIFDLYDRQGKAVSDLMDTFQRSGAITLGAAQLKMAQRLFVSARIDEAGTKAAIAEVYRRSGVLIDPHTAVGVAAGRRQRADRAIPLVSLATAHPAKFPEAVAAASGVAPKLPAHLADLLSRPERCASLPNDLNRVQVYIRDTVTAKA
ncbi:MAG: threonine synthase [Sphingomonadales bacterium]|nr:threonine synthase [Sphingomonadales bacterium]